MTTSAVVQTFLFIHIGVILVAIAYYLFSAAIAPGMVARSRTSFARKPIKPILLGAAISVPWVVIALMMMGAPLAPLKFLGVVLISLWVLLGLIGGAGVAQHIGGHDATAASPWTQTARGGLIISLTWILPFIGWLGMLPLTLATGIGCMSMAMFARRESIEAAA
jgi:hypothetical protein